MGKNTFYITTPIYYPSGRFHIGTAYTTVIADALARFKRLEGYDVKFLTGMDEHGQKIQLKAEEEGKTPQEYVDEIAENAKKLWALLNISNDDFIRTTEPRHEAIAKKVYQKFVDNGDIYKGSYSGWYCTPCETFFTESQLVDGKCPDCGRAVGKMSEEAYFFNIKKYQERLLKFYEENPDWIQPTYRKDEMVRGFVEKGLEDLCVSRTTFDWGIRVPNDPKHVMYVWVDALSNYLSALGFLSEDDSEFKKYWPADVQIIGKDIVRFHTIYWPIFLMSLGLPMPKKMLAHSWVMMKDGKMSKSKGNVIYPDALSEKFGVDAVRFFLILSMPIDSDCEFTPEGFAELYNVNLCNDLGNLLNRTIAMINKYNGGIIGSYKGHVTDFDEEVENEVTERLLNTKEQLNALHFSNAISELWKIVSRTNKYIDQTEPWVLAKDETLKDKLNSTMYHLAENLRIFAVYLQAFLPDTAKNIFEQLGITDNSLKTLESVQEYGKITGEIKVIEKGVPMFNRLDMVKDVEEIKNLMKN